MLDALEAGASEDPAVLVHHARGAGDPARVLRYATEAGVAAARTGAHTQAAEFFALALEHGDAGRRAESEGWPARAARAGAVRPRPAGRGDQLGDRRRWRCASRPVTPAAVSTDHQALATYEWYRANRDAADRHAADAVAVLGGADEPTPLGHALALQAYLAMQANDLTTAHELCSSRHASVGAGATTGCWTCAPGCSTASARSWKGGPAAATSVLEIVEPAVDRIDEIHSSGFSNLAYLDVEQRRLPEAAAVLSVSLPLTVEFDLPVCHVWQLGARGRLGLLQGDWAAAEDDAAAVLDRPSAPLARTWAHLVRGLVGLRRTGDAGADLDDAWDLATRLGEPLRLMPAAAALVERVWLSGVPTPGSTRRPTLLRRFDGVGLEWARGDLAVWLQRLDPRARDRRPRGVGAAPAPAVRPARRGRGRRGSSWTRRTTRRWRWSEPGSRTRSGRASACSTASVPTPSRRRLRQDLRDRGVTNVPARPRAATLTNAGRPDGARGRGARPARRGPEQRRARRAAVHLAEDGRPPRVGDPGQAAGAPTGGRRPEPGASSASSADRGSQSGEHRAIGGVRVARDVGHNERLSAYQAIHQSRVLVRVATRFLDHPRGDALVLGPERVADAGVEALLGRAGRVHQHELDVLGTQDPKDSAVIVAAPPTPVGRRSTRAPRTRACTSSRCCRRGARRGCRRRVSW